MTRPAKVLGIVGGMGAAASAALLQRLVELTPARTDQEHVEVIVHNNPRIPDRTRGILDGGPSPLPEIRRSVQILNGAGADIILLACITAHHFIEELQAGSEALVIDGIAETVRHCEETYSDVACFGILGSTGSIRLELFQAHLANRGMGSVVLDRAEQDRHFTEPIYAPWGVKAGHIEGRPTDLLLAGVDRLRDRGAGAVIGACSELPLVFSTVVPSLPLIDAMDCMCRSAIVRCTAPPSARSSRLRPLRPGATRET